MAAGPRLPLGAQLAPPPSATSRTRSYGLLSLQEPWIDTTTPIGEAVCHITIAWAGLEKQTLSERTRAGMERASEEGGAAGAGPAGGTARNAARCNDDRAPLDSRELLATTNRREAESGQPRVGGDRVA